MKYNALSVQISEHAGVTEKKEVSTAGTKIGPWTLIIPGNGELFWFYGGPVGVFIPDGSIVQGWGSSWKLVNGALTVIPFEE